MAKATKDYTSNNNAKENDYSALRAVYPDAESRLAADYPEIEDIREDLVRLKEDVVSLTQHARSNSGKHIEDAKRFAGKQLKKAQKAGVEVFHKIEHRVTEKPGQSIALAFFAGLAASMLLGRRH